MKDRDEFTYYEVVWFYLSSSGVKMMKSRKFYDKKEALEWYESVPEERREKVTKHTESIEVIA